MDLERLHEFACIAGRGSVTAAARELGVSVATLSARLRSMEKQLGFPLFEREGRSFSLTDAGRCLLDNADDILSRYRLIAGELRTLKERQYARLVIAMDNPIPLHLGPLLDQLNLANPEMRLQLLSTRDLPLWDALLRGDADIVFASDIGDPVPEGILRREISDPFQNVILPADHPLAGRSSVSLRELAGACFILYADLPNAFARAFQLRNLEASGMPFTVYDENPSQELIQFLVPIGKGVLITPYHLIDIPNAVELPLTDLPFPSRPCLFAAEEPPRPDAARFVRDFFSFAAGDTRGFPGKEAFR